jgi:hypothetical protein
MFSIDSFLLFLDKSEILLIDERLKQISKNNLIITFDAFFTISFYLLSFTVLLLISSVSNYVTLQLIFPKQHCT